MAIGKWISFGAAQSPAATPIVVPAQPHVISAADAKQFGLENYGNTCYANSVLQALYFCGPFRELLVQYPDPAAPELPFPPSLPPPAPLPPAAQPQPVLSNTRKKLDRKYSVSEAAAPQPRPSFSSSPPSNVPGSYVIPPHPPTLLSALRSLFVHISKHPSERGTVAPRAFIDKLKELNELFRGPMHQDAHEFLNFLLNKIMEEMEDDRRNGLGSWQASGKGVRNGMANGSAAGSSLNGEDLSSSIDTLSSTAAGPSSPGSKTSHAQLQATIVHRLFEGVLTSETRCLTCETVSSRDESFLDLSIDIEQNSSVTACLRQFSASEMLCQKNKFFCDSCCDLQEAEKRMKIKKLPNVLALHLKRFKYQEDVGKYTKLTYRVAFPLELRLFNTVDDAENPDRLYELFAIVVHIGNGPHHGHYVTIIKARGTWLLFDDDSVDVIKESDIPRYYGESTNGSAYVLYYQAVDVDMVALGLKAPEPLPSAADIGSAPAAKAADALTITVTGSGSSDVDLGSPTLPPGLTEEDSSGRSESSSPLPATPASQRIPLTASQSKGPSGPTPPSLSLSIPSSSSQTASVPSTPVASTSHGSSSSGLGGLFNTLRHSRSSGAEKGSDIRKSWLNADSAQVPPVPSLPPPSTKKPRRPTTATSLADTTEGYESPGEPSSPSLHYNSGGVNGTGAGKTPERKGSVWFKRKSSRLEVSPNGTSFATGRDGTHARAQAVGEGASIPKRGSMVASGPDSTGSSSVPSAFAGQAGPMPMSPTVPPPPTHQPRPTLAEHKKSSPDLPKSKGSRSFASSALNKLPRRPSTAGATVGSSSSMWTRPSSIQAPPPLPLPLPLPTLPIAPVQNGDASVQRRALSTQDLHAPSSPRPEHPFAAADAPSTPTHAPKRPTTAHGGTPAAIGVSASNSTSSTVSYGTPLETQTLGKKRTTRKLSFTAPMLGFGRREKERRKDKQSPPPPPSSFALR